MLILIPTFLHSGMGWAFPNAIYINGVASGGVIRTGTQPQWADASNEDEHKDTNKNNHATTAYAYVDTIVAFNLYLACNPDNHHYDPNDLPTAAVA